MTIKTITSDTFNNIAHGFFTRQASLPKGIYHPLNSDTPSAVNHDQIYKNREKIAMQFGINIKDLLLVQQIHSNRVLYSDSLKNNSLQKADAIVSDDPNVAIGILTADCAPILFHDAKANIIGAAHSGWKGALRGIIRNTVEAMINLGATSNNICAIIGPCISQKNYEVGQDFFDIFLSENKIYTEFFTHTAADKYLFNLPDFCLLQLKNAGIQKASWTGHCTYQDPLRFYSYRRSTHLQEPDEGRLISIITLANAK